jgi:hypothetical protein
VGSNGLLNQLTATLLAAALEAKMDEHPGVCGLAPLDRSSPPHRR